MQSVDRLVKTWVASQRDEEIVETVSEISNGQTTLLAVVKALGEYLTSEEDDLRTKGVDFLSLVLKQCPPEKLNRQSARVLITFYCGKLEDSATIIPALRGLVSLTQFESCTSSDATTVVQALFSHVRMKALVQANRFLVFTTINTLLSRHLEVLKTINTEFLSGYISLAEGEKDPRNLMLAFAIARVLLIEFDTSRHTESLFDITFCYFPITFRPPPDDPYGISTDDLKRALKDCLTSTPSFGPLALPVYLEKLTAGSPTTKRDTLQAMAASFPVYGAALARVNARKLWSSLKLEIFQPTDPITEEEALKTTQALIKTIYSDEEKETTEIQGLAKDACEECVQVLREPEKSQAKPAIKILCAFMSTTPSVSMYTISQAVPHLVKLFLDPDEISNRPAVLSLLSDLITAARDSLLRENQISLTEHVAPLTPYKDEVLGVLTVGFKTIDSRRPALVGLKSLVTTKGILSEEELGFIVHNVNEILKDDPADGDDTSESMLELLSMISASAHRHVEEQTLPMLFTLLPDQAPPREVIAERARYWRVLLALSTLCIQTELFETFIVRLLTKLEFICATSDSVDADVEPDAAYAHAILTIISRTLNAKLDRGHPDIVKYVHRLTPRLFNIFIHTALSPGEKMVANDPRLIAVAAQIIGSIVQSLNQQQQEPFTRNLFSAYLSNNFKDLAEGQHKFQPDVNFAPFEDRAPETHKELVALFAAAVIPLHKELRLPVPDLNGFLNKLTTWGLSRAATESQRGPMWQTIASVVNKHADEVLPFLTECLDVYWSREVGGASAPPLRRQQALAFWVWISKALLARGHELSGRFIDRFFEIFSDEHIGWNAAKAIGEIGGSDVVLTKRNHAVVRIFYSQKFFNGILPRIVAGAKDSTEPRTQTSSLVALTWLIKSVSKAVYSHELPTLIPLLLRGLDLPDTQIRANVIDTFLAAAAGDSPQTSIISEHASTLVSTMLKNSMVQEMTNTRVRVAALKYLGVLPSIVRYDVLHPYKPTVLRELAKVLDDPKRSVRKEAVDARTNWFKYNG